MATSSVFDVIVGGGGIAGSTLAGVLARAGFGVLVVEKEARFRDRVRGEGTWPWGAAEARRLGLGDLMEQAGAVEIRAMQRYEDQRPVDTYAWATDSIDGVPELGFAHTRLQEAAFTWAAAHGATTLRPAKAVAVAHNGRPAVTVIHDDRQVEVAARLIVGADGKLSAARRWTGGESVADPEHHRMGGVLVSGATFDRECDNYSKEPGVVVNWFAAGEEMTRLYLVMTAARLRATGVDRSFAAILAFAGRYMPEGALDGARQAGPIGYHATSDTWASRIAGNGVVLIGDAAGAPDPSQGHGTALLFRDARELSELLMAERDWDGAIAEFATRRRTYFEVILEYDRWPNLLAEEGAAADRRREGHKRATAHDPTLGGFAVIEARGPDTLVADEVPGRHYFGEDLA
jgi:2-polyprenyl-6-methoxyphenol hydroxylase-like FAD-dependent oxidoreductase